MIGSWVISFPNTVLGSAHKLSIYKHGISGKFPSGNGCMFYSFKGCLESMTARLARYDHLD